MTANLFLRMAGLVVCACTLILFSKYIVLVDPFHTLAKEIGFAFIVSAVLWAVFELHISNRSEQIWERRIDHITKNVFEGVLRKDLPQGLIDEVQRMILDAQFVRTSYQIEYGLRDATFEAAPGKQADCVELTARLSYSLTNITKKELPLSISIVLPNPIHPGLKKFCSVKTFKISRSGKQLDIDLEVARAGFIDALVNNNCTEVPFILPAIYIPAGKTVSVEAEYAMPKETEDSELLEMLYPGDGLSMTINDRGSPGGRVIFARAVHRLPIEASTAELNPETKYLRINDYVLPCQGVLLWWKRTPPSGLQSLPSESDRLDIGK